MDPDRTCPDASAIARFLDNTLSTGERDAIVRHAGSCPDCCQLLLLSARALSLSESSGAGSQSGIRWRPLVALAAAAALLLGLLWVLESPRPAPVPPGRPAALAIAPEAPRPGAFSDPAADRARIASAMRGLVACGYPAIEVTRLAARSAQAGVRGQDMVDLVQAMEQAACNRKDATRLRDEVLEAAGHGTSGPALKQAIREKLQGLPLLNYKADNNNNG